MSSERMRLARIAREVALSTAGVVRAESGPSGAYVTAVPGSGPLYGVVCVAAPTGGYDVSLRLVAAPVPLHPLGATISERIRATATAAGLGGALEGIDVIFADIETEASA